MSSFGSDSKLELDFTESVDNISFCGNVTKINTEIGNVNAGQVAEISNINAGHIEVILGPMFSGKTTELIRRIRRYTIAKKRCLQIKYKADTRYSEECASTHDKQMIAAKSCTYLKEAENLLENYDVIGIDEGQFFQDVVSFAEEAANKGKIVIVSALDGTFKREAFGSILDLIPIAEKVTKLNAVCMLCCQEASFTKRLSEETAIEVIGGSDKYIAVCRSCFFSNKN